jgi:hypothetical protein
MSGNGQQWAALESQHERLAEASRPVLQVTRRWGRLPWQRRVATAIEAEQPAGGPCCHELKKGL